MHRCCVQLVALQSLILTSSPPLPPALSQRSVNTAWLESLGSALRPRRFPVAMESRLWAMASWQWMGSEIRFAMAGTVIAAGCPGCCYNTRPKYLLLVLLTHHSTTISPLRLANPSSVTLFPICCTGSFRIRTASYVYRRRRSLLASLCVALGH